MIRIFLCFAWIWVLVLPSALADDVTHHYNPFGGGGEAVVDSAGLVWYQLRSQMIGFDPAAGMTTVLSLPFSQDASIAIDAEAVSYTHLTLPTN